MTAIGGDRIGLLLGRLAVAALLLTALVLLRIASPTQISAAAPSYTGFVVDSEIDSRLGPGQVHDHDPSALVGTTRANGAQIEGSGWRFVFDGPNIAPGGLAPGTYTSGSGANLAIVKDGDSCSPRSWSFIVLEQTVLAGANVTTFAADFRVGNCSLSERGMHGSVRLHSAQPTRLLHVTSEVVFADTLVGELTVEQEIVVRNVGGTFVTVGPASLTGANASDFTATDGCAPVVLDPEQECGISVDFHPSATTARVASVQVPSDTFATRVADLEGYGLSPLTLLGSALVIDSVASPIGNGDHWYDPTDMTANGNGFHAMFSRQDWGLMFTSPDIPMTEGHYADISRTGGAGKLGLSIQAFGRSCEDPISGWVDILQAPVLDTDDTLLQFAADFEYDCPGAPGEVMRGWLRFHSEIPVPKREDLGYTLDVSAGPTVQVGETVTITPNVTGTDFLRYQRCTMILENRALVDPLYMYVASDDCAPWTFVLPPAPLGTYVVSGRMYYGEQAAPSTSTTSGDTVIEIVAGGTPQPYTSNYPVHPWSIADLVSDPTPTYGTPWTVSGRPGADGCEIALEAGFEGSWIRQFDGCDPWTLAIPAPTPNAAETWQRQGSHLLVTDWTGTSDWLSTDLTSPLTGARWGQTHTTALPDLTGTSTAPYQSDQPAVFMGAAREQFFYSDDPASHTYTPIVKNVSTGTCHFLSPASTRPVNGGACGSVTLGPPGFIGNLERTIRLEVLDTSGRPIAGGATAIHYAPKMDAIDLTIPATGQLGFPLSITASNDKGLPSTYEINVDAGAAEFTGSFPKALDKSGDTITVEATGLGLGQHTVLTTFVDLTGDLRTASKSVTIVDTTGPSGAISIEGGAAYTTTNAVTLDVTATDAGLGVSQVSLSNDGVNWITRPYAGTQAWTLATTNGKRTVYVKWKDVAGNWSAAKTDSIVLDTLAPTTTSPTRSFAASTNLGVGGITTRVSWTGTDAGGIAAYELEQRTDLGSWTPVATGLTGAASNRWLSPGHSYAFRVRATDNVGHVGAWATSASLKVTGYSEASAAVKYSGTWSAASSTAYWGGKAKSSIRAGSKSTFTFTGRSVAIVSRLGPGRGKAEIWMGTTRLATVDLGATTYSSQRVIWTKTWSTPATRAITIKVLGTTGRPRVEVDGFIVGS